MSMFLDGFVIRTSALEKVDAIVTAFRPIALRLLDERYRGLLATKAARLIDNALVRGLPWAGSPLGTVWEEIADRRRKIETTGYRDPKYDFDFKIILIPDAETDSTYGIVYTEHRPWRDAWLSQQGVADFLYYDASDHPEEISSTEWETRQHTWARITPSGIPAQHGYEVNFLPKYFHADVQEVLSYIPSAADRALALAAEIASERWMSQDPPSDSRGWIERAIKAAQWITTEEGLAARDQILATLQLPDIDRDMLISNEAPGTRNEMHTEIIAQIPKGHEAALASISEDPRTGGAIAAEAINSALASLADRDVAGFNRHVNYAKLAIISRMVGMEFDLSRGISAPGIELVSGLSNAQELAEAGVSSPLRSILAEAASRARALA